MKSKFMFLKSFFLKKSCLFFIFIIIPFSGFSSEIEDKPFVQAFAFYNPSKISELRSNYLGWEQIADSFIQTKINRILSSVDITSLNEPIFLLTYSRDLKQKMKYMIVLPKPINQGGFKMSVRDQKWLYQEVSDKIILSQTELRPGQIEIMLADVIKEFDSQYKVFSKIKIKPIWDFYKPIVTMFKGLWYQSLIQNPKPRNTLMMQGGELLYWFLDELKAFQIKVFHDQNLYRISLIFKFREKSDWSLFIKRFSGIPQIDTDRESHAKCLFSVSLKQMAHFMTLFKNRCQRMGLLSQGNHWWYLTQIEKYLEKGLNHLGFALINYGDIKNPKNKFEGNFYILHDGKLKLKDFQDSMEMLFQKMPYSLKFNKFLNDSYPYIRGLLQAENIKTQENSPFYILPPIIQTWIRFFNDGIGSFSFYVNEQPGKIVGSVGDFQFKHNKTNVQKLSNENKSIFFQFVIEIRRFLHVYNAFTQYKGNNEDVFNPDVLDFKWLSFDISKKSNDTIETAIELKK